MHDRAGGRDPLNAADAEPPDAVDDRGHEQPQRGPRRAPDGDHHGDRREQGEDREDRPRGEQRRSLRTEWRPQAAVGERGQEHAAEKQEVRGCEYAAEPVGGAFFLQNGLQRDVEHAGPEAEHHEPDDRPPGHARIGGEERTAGQGEGQERHRHDRRAERHETEIDPRVGDGGPRRDPSGDHAAGPDASDEGDQEGHDPPLRCGTGLGAELIDVRMGHGADRPEEQPRARGAAAARRRRSRCGPARSMQAVPADRPAQAAA